MDKSSWPIVSKNEIKVINQVLASNNLNYWTGKNCTKFEKNFSKLFNIKYSISLANGSVGLESLKVACPSIPRPKNKYITNPKKISDNPIILDIFDLVF